MLPHIEFTYTKSPDKVSRRSALVIEQPGANYKCIDITEITDPDIFEEALNEFNVIIKESDKRLLDFMQKYDLVHNYRLFNPDKMSNIES